jgi:hypothetical protein
VLFAPEDNEEIWYPDPDGSQPVEAGVAAGTYGNQPVAVVDAGLTVMHMEPVGRAAGPALMVVALQNLPAEAGEVFTGMGSGPVAGAAEASDGGEVLAAGTE